MFDSKLLNIINETRKDERECKYGVTETTIVEIATDIHTLDIEELDIEDMLNEIF